MAKMYAALDLKADPKLLERGSYLRAAAAQYRDLTQTQWGGATAQDWAIVEKLLLHAYDFLYSTHAD